MNLQQVLLLVGTGVFLLILLDALRRRFLSKSAPSTYEDETQLDAEEQARQAELARELPGIQNTLDPLFDNLEVFDDDPIPLLSNQQQLKLSPSNKLAAQQIIAAKYPNQKSTDAAVQQKTAFQSEVENSKNSTAAPSASSSQKTGLAKEQLSFNLPAEKPSQAVATEHLAWEKMRRKFELDPSFAEASRVSMQAQQKELSLLQTIKTQEALRYGAVKKQNFDQESDLADLDLPKNLLLTPNKPTAAASLSNKKAVPQAQQAAHLSASLANSQAVVEAEAQPEVPAQTAQAKEQQLKQQLLASLETTTWGQATEFLTLNLHANPDQPFYFSQLKAFAKEIGLHFSNEGYYHHLEEVAGQNYLGFSLINMLKPGNFLTPSTSSSTSVDLDLAGASTQGLVLLTALPNTPEPLNMFERMLAVAKVIARNWGAELQDEHYSDLTQQTIEHYRQKIKDFEFQAKINAIKASRLL